MYELTDYLCTFAGIDKKRSIVYNYCTAKKKENVFMKRDLCFYYDRPLNDVFNAYVQAITQQVGKGCQVVQGRSINFGLNYSFRYNMNGGFCNILFIPYQNGTAVNMRYTIIQLLGARYTAHAQDVNNYVFRILQTKAVPLNLNVSIFEQTAGNPQPVQPVNQNAYAQPAQPMNQNAYAQHVQPMNQNGYAQPVQQMNQNGYAQPVQQMNQNAYTPQQGQVTKYCVTCGAPYISGTAFCAKCGCKLP